LLTCQPSSDCSLRTVPECGHFVIDKTDFIRDELQRFIAAAPAPA
jgi:alpha/beta superfamily hydrolase